MSFLSNTLRASLAFEDVETLANELGIIADGLSKIEPRPMALIVGLARLRFLQARLCPKLSSETVADDAAKTLIEAITVGEA